MLIDKKKKKKSFYVDTLTLFTHLWIYGSIKINYILSQNYIFFFIIKSNLIAVYCHVHTKIEGAVVGL